VRTLYMPCWSLDELRAVLPHFPAMSRAVVEERFATFGGIPRYVLDEDEEWRRDLDKAIEKCNLARLRESVGGRDLQEEVSHRLLQYDVQQVGAIPLVRFASPYVERQVAEKLLTDERRALLHFVATAKEPTVASVRGKLFEEVAHRLLCTGSTFQVRRLADGVARDQVIPALTTTVFSTLDALSPHAGQAAALVDNVTYGRPRGPNFESVDSLAVIGGEVFAFQMTVSLSHPVKQQGLVNVAKTLGCTTMNLVFVVPDDIFVKFAAQPYHTAESKVVERLAAEVKTVVQWVLRLPLTAAKA